MTASARETRTAYLFLLPYLAVFAAFWAWPLVESALLSVLLTSMAGYAFARFRFVGEGVLFGLVMATLTVPFFVVVVPQYILVARTLVTAPVALGRLIDLTQVSWGGIMAGASILTVPMVVVFLLLQRHFVAGITAGAVK